MTAATMRTHLHRSRWRLLALLLVALAAVPVVRAANELRLHVDGDVREVLSFGSTVGAVLDEQGVELAAGDEVLPAPATPTEDVSAITILRTIDVALVVDGEATVHSGTWRTVEGMLADLDVDVAPTQVLRPGPRTMLADGDRVTVRSAMAVDVEHDDDVRTVRTHLTTVGELLDDMGLELGPDQRLDGDPAAPLVDGMTVLVASATPVSVAVDGEEREVDSFASTVDGLLAELGIELGPADVLEPALPTPLEAGTAVVVRRVTFDEVVEEVAVPFETDRRQTGDLYTDESRVLTSGVEGLRAETYRVRYVDGEEAGRDLLDSDLVREPTDEVVEVGTTSRPVATGSGVWYDLANCESGGRWDYNGSSGYDGGLQFHPDTWRRAKPAGYPEYAWQASAGQQIEVGKIVQRSQGWGAWPSCARKLGLL